MHFWYSNANANCKNPFTLFTKMMQSHWNSGLCSVSCKSLKWFICSNTKKNTNCMFQIQAIESRNRKLSKTELILLSHTNQYPNESRRKWYILGDETINSNLAQTKNQRKIVRQVQMLESRCKRIHNLAVIQSAIRMWMNVVVNNTTNDAQTKGFVHVVYDLCRWICAALVNDEMCIFFSLFQIHWAYYSFYI